MAKVNAVSYVRVSGLGQADGDGPERQRDAVAKYAKSQGLTIVREFQDLGVSGRCDMSDRPGLMELVDYVTDNKISLVVVENSSRWARDVMVGEIALAKMRELGVKVVDASGIDLTAGEEGDPTAVLIRQVLACFAAFERATMVAKLRASRERIRATGAKCEGRKSYGELPGEAETVELIHKLRRKPRGGERLSFQGIADELNSRGIQTRRGGPWRASTVGQVLGR